VDGFDGTFQGVKMMIKYFWMSIGGGGGYGLMFYFHSKLTSSLCVQSVYKIQKESVHASVKGGMKYNTGRLLMILHKPLVPQGGDIYDNGVRYGEEPDMGDGNMIPMP